ncbi:hypothetical protein C5167_049777 [Papaver somniferum]|uniref:Uncharacterized protein n=1 Tax=Papaver somniferum TaxID=3469 RepID=A0A4Y7KLS5_PAPSO|nr:hypothetical protein C5167_049777 [Papaver somniferum]
MDERPSLGRWRLVCSYFLLHHHHQTLVCIGRLRNSASYLRTPNIRKMKTNRRQGKNSRNEESVDASGKDASTPDR